MKKCIFGNFPIGKHGLISLFWSVLMYKKIFSVDMLTSYQFSLVRGFSGRGGIISRFRPHALTRSCCLSVCGSDGVIGFDRSGVGRCGRSLSLSLGGLSVSFRDINKCLRCEDVFIVGLLVVGWLGVMGSLSLLLVAVGLTLSGFYSDVHGVGSAVGSDAVGVGCLMGWGLFRFFTLSEIGGGSFGFL